MRVPLKEADEVGKCQPDGVANLTEFEHVYPAFSGFVSTDKGLRLPELVCQVLLAQPCVNPDLPE